MALGLLCRSTWKIENLATRNPSRVFFADILGILRGMLQTDEISQIVSEAVEANTAPNSVRRVMAEPTETFDGEDAVRITIVLTPEAVDQLAAGDPGDVFIRVWNAFRAAGDHRFPILDYATEAELEDVGDSES
jgi:hypothetical protein